jgi:hypothetical protein
LAATHQYSTAKLFGPWITRLSPGPRDAGGEREDILGVSGGTTSATVAVAHGEPRGGVARRGASSSSLISFWDGRGIALTVLKCLALMCVKSVQGVVAPRRCCRVTPQTADAKPTGRVYRTQADQATTLSENQCSRVGRPDQEQRRFMELGRRRIAAAGILTGQRPENQTDAMIV